MSEERRDWRQYAGRANLPALPPLPPELVAMALRGWLPAWDLDSGQWVVGDDSPQTVEAGGTTRRSSNASAAPPGSARGQPCKPGQTAERDKCIPATHEQRRQHAAQKRQVARDAAERATQERLRQPATAVLGSSIAYVLPEVRARTKAQEERALDGLGLGSKEEALAALPALVGAQPGSQIRVTGSSGSARLSVDHPYLDQQLRNVMVDQNGNLICSNQLFFLKKKYRGGGFGMKVFTDQVQAMVDAGADRIETCAGKGGIMNGYYTWPRFGYDCELREGFTRDLRNKVIAWLTQQGTSFEDATKRASVVVPTRKTADGKNVYEVPKTVLDLMSTEDGRAYWKKFGYMESMRFDCKPGSRSLQVLNKYLASKGKPPIEPKDPDKAERLRKDRKQSAGKVEAARKKRQAEETAEKLKAIPQSEALFARMSDEDRRRAITVAESVLSRVNHEGYRREDYDQAWREVEPTFRDQAGSAFERYYDAAVAATRRMRDNVAKEAEARKKADQPRDLPLLNMNLDAQQMVEAGKLTRRAVEQAISEGFTKEDYDTVWDMVEPAMRNVAYDDGLAAWAGAVANTLASMRARRKAWGQMTRPEGWGTTQRNTTRTERAMTRTASYDWRDSIRFRLRLREYQQTVLHRAHMERAQGAPIAELSLGQSGPDSDALGERQFADGAREQRARMDEANLLTLRGIAPEGHPLGEPFKGPSGRYFKVVQDKNDPNKKRVVPAADPNKQPKAGKGKQPGVGGTGGAPAAGTGKPNEQPQPGQQKPPAGRQKKPAAAPAQSAEDVHTLLAEHFDAASVTDEEADRISKAIGAMKMDQVRALSKKLFGEKGPKGRDKAVLAQSLAKAALEAVRGGQFKKPEEVAQEQPTEQTQPEEMPAESQPASYDEAFERVLAAHDPKSGTNPVQVLDSLDKPTRDAILRKLRINPDDYDNNESRAVYDRVGQVLMDRYLNGDDKPAAEPPAPPQRTRIAGVAGVQKPAAEARPQQQGEHGGGFAGPGARGRAMAGGKVKEKQKQSGSKLLPGNSRQAQQKVEPSDNPFPPNSARSDAWHKLQGALKSDMGPEALASHVLRNLSDAGRDQFMAGIGVDVPAGRSRTGTLAAHIRQAQEKRRA